MSQIIQNNVLKGHAFQVFSVAFSHFHNNLLASGSENNTVILWDFEKKIQIAVLKGHNHYVWSVAFSPFHKNLLSSGSNDATIILSDIKPVTYPPRYVKIKKILVSFLLCLQKLNIDHFKANNLKMITRRFLIEPF